MYQQRFYHTTGYPPGFSYGTPDIHARRSRMIFRIWSFGEEGGRAFFLPLHHNRNGRENTWI